MRLVQRTEGIAVYVDERAGVLARSAGLWPRKRIVVNAAWELLPEPERTAVVYHELGHCRGMHMEKRVAMLAIALIPVMVAVPWPILVGVVATAIAWELATWLARQHEFDADRYAARRGHGAGLVRFLARARGPNDGASDFYPSHSERIEALATIPREAPCSND